MIYILVEQNSSYFEYMTSWKYRIVCFTMITLTWPRGETKLNTFYGKDLKLEQWNEYNWNATSIVIDGKIMKPNFAWYFTQTRVSGWSITRVSFATIPRTNYEERANDERTTWRQTWVPRKSKFAVCLKHTYRCSYSHETYHLWLCIPI